MSKNIMQNSKSLKTFFVYSGIVVFFILIALAVKVFFLIQNSRFDGRHQFVLIVSRQDVKTKEIIKFDPSNHEISVLQLNGVDITVIPDATVIVGEDFNLNTNIPKVLEKITTQYNTVTTNLTLIDIVRLLFLSYNSKIKSVNYRQETNILVDELISSENISIQIINASGISGIGKKLGNIFENLGCNVVAVTTSSNEEKISKIQYFGRKTYTLEKIKKLLGFSTEETPIKKIADITVVLGKDSKNLDSF